MADNWYEIIELSPTASPEEIRKQYHFLCKVWHPDRFSSGLDKARAEEKMKKINAAYTVLSDPGKRAAYDAGRALQGAWEEKGRRWREEAWWEKENGAEQSVTVQHTGRLWRRLFFAVSIPLVLVAVVWIVYAVNHRTPSHPTAQAQTTGIRTVDVSKTRLAAERGNAQAQNILGVLYAKGQGVTRNYQEAVNWYRRAAAQGNAQAQNNLGFMYAQGLGVTRDYLEAVNWYRKAAEQGHADAQGNLGNRYYNGQGVMRDYDEAIKWYRLAAEHGNVNAQRILGVMYAKGQGVPQDYTEGYTWLMVAAANGADVKANQQFFQERMTDWQIEAAGRRAKEILARLKQK
ncbi:MAG TPA: hypothetical protein DEB25_09305 [Desulfobulbaceae bacterium]|nr:hypothetical protein [Desulfobulbaceae bacterium]